MILGEIARRLAKIEHDRPFNVLDSCAAPGGKTTALVAALPSGSAIIANEYDYRRAEILRENVAKWGTPSVAVTRGDTSQFSRLKNTFSLILADMPCSGEGMMRKDSQAAAQWSPRLVEQCAQRQLQIARNLLPALAPGGYFIYSTCTFNLEENELNVERIALEHGLEFVDLKWPDVWKLMPSALAGVEATRFMPQHLRGEGLFVAVMRKPGTLPAIAHTSLPERKASGAAAQWVPDIAVRRVADTLWGATPELDVLIQTVTKKTNQFLTFGTELAQFKGKDLIPSHELALSTALDYEAFPRIDLDTEQALIYLRRENLALPFTAPNGHVLLCHNGLPLGFAKNLGNRINNLMPKEWRIRH